MPSVPLQPFSSLSSLINLLPTGVSVNSLADWLLYAVFAFWTIYTIVAAYHWIRYSHASWVALPAIGVHLFVSLACLAYALSGTLAV